jgi:peptidyl-prolyl cis-trans isomerase B (cyclophilin B)
LKTPKIKYLYQLPGKTMRVLFFSIMLFLTTTLSFATETKMPNTSTKVKLTTNLGQIVIQLNTEKAPVSSENFLTYVKEGFYNGTIFHRVIKDFMAQGGGFDKDFKQKTTHNAIKNEANNGLTNKRGTLAMARTSDPDSATAQFFINYKDNAFLNHTSPTPSGWGYAVFGEVLDGMDVVDAMAKQPTTNRGAFQDVPKTDIIIEKAEIVE